MGLGKASNTDFYIHGSPKKDLLSADLAYW